MTDALKQTYYFIGIGGVGMSALARWCQREGHEVYGYDKTPSEITEQLIKDGFNITFDLEVSALPQNLLEPTVQVVYTAAIDQSHPQLAYYLAQGNAVKKRAEFLAECCANKMTFAVAGTHGKTTTAAILTHIFTKTKRSFTSVMGGFMNHNSSNLIGTGSETFIVEADEFDRSFLHLHPSFACITSLEPDHLDVYKTNAAFLEAFIQFSKQVDHKLIVAYGLPISGISFGVDVEADYKAFNLQTTSEGYCFDLTTPTGTFKKVYLNQLGSHNVANTLAAIALAEQAGTEMDEILPLLKSFPGVYRRMNLYRWEEAIVIDDYAHHPTEIQRVYETIQSFYPTHRNCVVFQPHLFSRTQNFWKEFSTVLSQFDEVVLMDIYPARETPIAGVTSKHLLEGIPHNQKKHILKTEIQSVIESSDASVFALLGAGDIGTEIQRLKPELESL